MPQGGTNKGEIRRNTRYKSQYAYATGYQRQQIPTSTAVKYRGNCGSLFKTLQAKQNDMRCETVKST